MKSIYGNSASKVGEEVGLRVESSAKVGRALGWKMLGLALGIREGVMVGIRVGLREGDLYERYIID